MSARLGPGNLLYDHGLPLRKLAMDRAAPAGDGVPWSSLSPGQQQLLGQVANANRESWDRLPVAWDRLPAAAQRALERTSQEWLDMNPHQRRAALDAMERATAPAPMEVTLDTGDALRDREQLAKLIPNLYRL